MMASWVGAGLVLWEGLLGELVGVLVGVVDRHDVLGLGGVDGLGGDGPEPVEPGLLVAVVVVVGDLQDDDGVVHGGCGDGCRR
jgi:hypothetical protein